MSPWNMAQFDDIIARHGWNCVIYADDSRLLCLACNSVSDYPVRSNRGGWDVIGCELLALNDGKTEIVWLSFRTKNSLVASIRFASRLRTSVSPVTPAVHDLGVMMNSVGVMKKCFSNVCSKAWVVGQPKSFTFHFDYRYNNIYSTKIRKKDYYYSKYDINT